VVLSIYPMLSGVDFHLSLRAGLVGTNVPSNFLKSVCAQHFFCAALYLNSSEFGMTCMKYVQKHIWKELLCVLQVFLCSLVSQSVCARTRAQLRGNIG